jgi:hypothetical protein
MFGMIPHVVLIEKGSYARFDFRFAAALGEAMSTPLLET